ncbi:alpha/beta hydrolase [Ancylomarina longa]|uniref:Uncharacterized protein n=1 Tax=Ancylomarina longa TaxID=2487017 RepID=A0A434AFB8_9BACT|nr:alpha/beta hydrolase-fold protein [Ancylomarina longa]RUT73015.1 hypothetical protein DLK05_15440 [Ancylomarina longa]
MRLDDSSLFEKFESNTNLKACKGKIIISEFNSNCHSGLPYFVYLPPNWSTEEKYPLLLFLHGQGGDETTFQKYVQAYQLNTWIEKGEIEPIVIVGIRGDNDRENVQWFTEENENLLIEEIGGEFITYCQTNFNAGMDANQISIEGHSRGAAGAIHFFLKYPGSFASFVAMGYVSNYTLVDNYLLAKKNLSEILKIKAPLRLEIGTKDRFVLEKNRQCAFDLHHFLSDQKIAHSFNVLPGVEHGFDTFWNYQTDQGIANGLSHLQFHEKSRKIGL